MDTKLLKTTCKFAIIISLVSIVFACEKDVSAQLQNHSDSVIYTNRKIELTLHEMYLWYDKLPNNINPANYSDPYSYLEAMIYKPIDKWSCVLTKKEFEDYFTKGKYIGYGFSLGIDQNDKLRISFVYSNSDIYKAGVRRGWIIEKINNVSADTLNIKDLLGENTEGTSADFLFQKPDGTELSLNLTKKEITINTVLYYDTLTIDNKIAGYLVFNDFLATANAELDHVFNYFKQHQVTELILDLRYNNGGEFQICNHLADLIGGITASKQVFVKTTYNQKYEYKNQIYYLNNNSLSMNYNMVYFITSGETASASEDLINGLKPYINQKLIGTNTHGKPTGMNVFRLPDYYLLPVTFKVANSQNYTDFFSGLPVDKVVGDDLLHDFGDRHEACLNEARYHIKNGSFSTIKSQKIQNKKFIFKRNSFENLIKAF